MLLDIFCIPPFVVTCVYGAMTDAQQQTSYRCVLKHRCCHLIISPRPSEHCRDVFRALRSPLLVSFVIDWSVSLSRRSLVLLFLLVSFYLFLNILVSVSKPFYTLYRASSPGSDVKHDVIINMFLDSTLNTRREILNTKDVSSVKLTNAQRRVLTESNSLIYFGYYLIS